MVLEKILVENKILQILVNNKNTYIGFHRQLHTLNFHIYNFHQNNVVSENIQN